MRPLLTLLHVFAAFWFVSGLVARNVTLSKAARSREISSAQELLELSGTFEKKMVIPGSLVVLALGVLLVFVAGYRFAGPGSNWILTSLLLFASVMVLVPTVFIPRGKRFEQILNDARRRGEVTPELTAAFADPAVKAAHLWELAALAGIIVLMVTKPF